MTPGLRRQLSTYALTLPGRRNPPPTRFALFAQGRAGTTLLGELIASHPDVVWAGEILEERVLAPRRWVEGCSRRRSVPVFGFKVKIYQLTEQQKLRHPGPWVRRLHANGWRLLYLWRRNVVRQVLSNMVREARGRPHDRVDMPDEVTRIHVDPSKLLHYCRLREETRQRELAVLGGLPFETFNYEDDLLDDSKWQATADRAFAHLGLDPVPVATTLRRINAAPLRDVISNYEEVEHVLRATPLGSYLDRDE